MCFCGGTGDGGGKRKSMVAWVSFCTLPSNLLIYWCFIELHFPRVSILFSHLEPPCCLQLLGILTILPNYFHHRKSLLVLGPPGSGKTTMLREVARLHDQEFQHRVVIVDTSSEIAGWLGCWSWLWGFWRWQRHGKKFDLSSIMFIVRFGDAWLMFVFILVGRRMMNKLREFWNRDVTERNGKISNKQRWYHRQQSEWQQQCRILLS